MRQSTVWEIRNETLKEVFVGLSDRPLEEIKSRLTRALPAPISHWNMAAHKIIYAPLAPAIPFSDARDFAFHYVKTISGGDRRIRTLPKWEF